MNNTYDAIITPYYVRYNVMTPEYEKEEHIRYFERYEDFIHYISKMALMNDILDFIEIIDAVADGLHFEYYGWLPNMEARFVNRDNRKEILWDAFYPEWDH